MLARLLGIDDRLALARDDAQLRGGGEHNEGTLRRAPGVPIQAPVLFYHRDAAGLRRPIPVQRRERFFYLDTVDFSHVAGLESRALKLSDLA